MRYLIFGVNIKDEKVNNPFITAIGATEIEGDIYAETFLELVSKEFIDDLSKYDFLICFDDDGQLFFRTVVKDNVLSVAICSLKDKLDIFQGVINWNAAVDCSVKTNLNSSLPKVNIDKLDSELSKFIEPSKEEED